MGHSFSCAYLHIVFSTSRRIAFFQDPGFRDRLHAFIGGIIRSLHCEPIAIGGPADHLHILLKIDRDHSIGEIVKEIKRVSTLWVNNQSPAIPRFSWQTGYGVFSVSQSMLGTARTYIENQEEHHRRISFEDEFSLLLQKHGIILPRVERPGDGSLYPGWPELNSQIPGNISRALPIMGSGLSEPDSKGFTCPLSLCSTASSFLCT